MYFLLALLPILCLALAAGRLLRRALWQTFAASLFFVVLVVYLCGLLGALAAGPFVVCALGLASLAYLIVSFVKDRSLTENKNAFPALTLALVLGGATLIMLFTIGRKVTDMDSFEQWAYVVKKMYLTGSLLAARGQYATTAAYPPGVALLQYYFARFSPIFNEADLFRARDLLSLALLLPFFRRLNWPHWKTPLLLIPIVFLLPYLEYSTFASSLEVDPLLGLLFAWLIITCAAEERVDGFMLASLALGSFMLAMAKVSGFLFALLAVAMLFFARLYRARIQSGSVAARQRWALPALVVLGAGLIGAVGCRLYVAAGGSAISASAGLLSLGDGLAQYQKETIVNFLEALFAAEGGAGFGALSPALWIFAVPALSAVALRVFARDVQAARRGLVDSLLLTAGYLVWLVLLLVGYLTSFVEGEAVSLAAFSRYLSSYQLGALVVCAWSLVQGIESVDPRRRHTRLAVLLLVLVMLAPLGSVFSATLGAPYANGKTADWRQRYAPAARYYETLDPVAVKLCYLDQNPNEPGYSFAMFQFEALPVDVEKAVAWRLGGPYYEEDYYSLSPSLEEWEQALLTGGFTHLYLRNTNAYFERTFGSLFLDPAQIQADSYYAISQQDGHIRLTKIDPSAN